jgi:ABC-2 type transport system ATP-binding protein
MPDHFGLYPELTAGELLELFATAYHIGPEQRPDLIADILNIVDLTDRRNTVIGGFSRGMQQKLSLGRCLIHDPEILILDEPASGLDPRARVELLECLRELRTMGKTILLSSHILAELEELCDLLIFIEDGALVYSGSLDDAAAHANHALRACDLVVSDPGPDTVRFVEHIAGVDDVTVDGRRLHISHDDVVTIADIIRSCAVHGIDIEEAHPGRPDLQQVFLQLTRDDD